VDDVSLAIGRGELVGLVGESGCGKSVTALSVLRLVPRPPGRFLGGRILFRDRDLLTLPAEELHQVRGRRISMIFQEPMNALSPLHRVGHQLAEALRLHRPLTAVEARAITLGWLQRVGIPDPEERLHAYPYQLSGGMLQRVMIAMALMLEPDLVIADEPTTALDVTIQAQVLDLMLARRSQDTSVLLITHDLGVVWDTCTRMVVMYASRVVEEGPVRETFRDPRHPYTQALLRSIASLTGRGERLLSIEGQVPSALAYPPGCRFAPRCPFATDRCRAEQPPLYPQGDGRRSACFLAETAGPLPAPPTAPERPA
jgi:peptide/nickel transport system ATP-binding protein/oligopeptide transport system ATP-binding protein